MDTKQMTRLEELELRANAVLLLCDCNEQMHDYTVSTGSIRAILTNTPLELNKQNR